VGVEQAYLRLEKHDEEYTAFYSEDGENWMVIGRHVHQTQPPLVGLWTFQIQSLSGYADFDYFIITQLP